MRKKIWNVCRENWAGLTFKSQSPDAEPDFPPKRQENLKLFQNLLNFLRSVMTILENSWKKFFFSRVFHFRCEMKFLWSGRKIIRASHPKKYQGLCMDWPVCHVVDISFITFSCWRSLNVKSFPSFPSPFLS